MVFSGRGDEHEVVCMAPRFGVRLFACLVVALRCFLLLHVFLDVFGGGFLKLEKGGHDGSLHTA